MRTRMGLAWVVVLALVRSLAFGQVPELINYQGRLLSGTNLLNGLVSLVLRVYDARSEGNLLYANSNDLTVVDGLYSVFLGTNTISGALTNLLGVSSAWLEVVVNATTLSPRERIGSVAYGLMAGAVRNGGITSAMLADNAVVASKIAAEAVTSQGIADRTILLADLGQNAASDGQIMKWSAAASQWIVGEDLKSGYGEHYRDNTVVAWAKVSQDGAVGTASFGVSSVTNLAAGEYEITLAASGSSASEVIPTVIPEVEGAPSGAANVRVASVNQVSENTFRVYINNGSFNLVNNDFVLMVTGR